MPLEPSARTGSEVKVVIRHDSVDLLEVSDVEYKVDRKGRPGGAGLGHPKNRYHKYGVPQGTYRIAKSWLNASEQADLFADLIAGVTAITTESFASGANSHTCANSPVSILAVVITGGDAWDILYEGDDFTVNYATGVVTFTEATSESGKVMYLTDASGTDDDALDGANRPFEFDVEWQDKASSTVLKRLRGCAPYTHSIKSGFGEEPFTEDLSGDFLYLETNPS
jgi:hypothetical protein